ncbi:MAG: transglycosylase SLT domain-containing protein, partial [Rudaea sp.]
MPRFAHLLLRASCIFVLVVASPGFAADRSELTRQREQFPAVWELAKHDPTNTWARLAAGLEAYPLYPYLGLAAMQRHIAEVKNEDVAAFLKAWPNSLPAALLRDSYLLELAKRRDWKEFLRLYDASITQRELRCDALQARLATRGSIDFATDLEPLWLGAAALPAACDAAIAWAQAQGKLTTALIWQRIGLLSTRSANAGGVTALAALLDGPDRNAAEHVALALRDPATALKQAPTWPDAVHSRDAIAIAAEHLARRDADSAEQRWTELAANFHFDAEQRGRALRAIALSRASSYAPDGLARLNALPAELANDATREWRVRSALAASDFKTTLAALESMPEAQRGDARWRYLRARMLAKLGRKVEADALFRTLAGEANFFGFLAADQTHAAYTICSVALPNDAATDDALRQNAGIARALEFFALNRLGEARREWEFTMPTLTAEERRRATALAAHAGWIDRPVYAFNQGDDMRLYDLRFPLAHRDDIVRAAATSGIDPAWAYAIIRAESAWTTDAKSAANAYGLMQLLPGTAKQLSKSDGIAYGGPADLFDADTNIALGTRYLGKVAARFDGSLWLGSAAYNAGPEAVDRWINQRDTLDPDFFIETIPYRETREYVSRVLAFAVIYDWRLHGKVQPLSARLPRIGQAY